MVTVKTPSLWAVWLPTAVVVGRNQRVSKSSARDGPAGLNASFLPVSSDKLHSHYCSIFLKTYEVIGNSS
jgi:hypothetical protein